MDHEFIRRQLMKATQLNKKAVIVMCKYDLENLTKDRKTYNTSVKSDGVVCKYCGIKVLTDEYTEETKVYVELE